MTRHLQAAVAAALMTLVLAPLASAATPIKRATYRGQVTSGAQQPVKVKLKVSSTGTRLTFVLSCYGSEAVRITGVKIADGKFTATKPYFSAKGTFVTRRKAKGTISGNACFLNGTVPWRAAKV